MLVSTTSHKPNLYQCLIHTGKKFGTYMRTSSANFGESSAKFGAGFTGGFAQSSELFNKFGEVEVRQVVSKCRTFAKSSVPLRQPRVDKG